MHSPTSSHERNSRVNITAPTGHDLGMTSQSRVAIKSGHKCQIFVRSINETKINHFNLSPTKNVRHKVQFLKIFEQGQLKIK